MPQGGAANEASVQEAKATGGNQHRRKRLTGGEEGEGMRVRAMGLG